MSDAETPAPAPASAPARVAAIAPWFIPDTKALIALAIIGLFAWAYIHTPTDLMSGALIAAFSGAWGYYLGSSKSASDSLAKVPNP